MDVTGTVANNLKTLREERRLSLDAVAKLSGVSKSMIGQIERGEVNPTISVLWKIANGLKISFSALLEKPAQQMQVIKAGAVRPMVECGGGFINHPLFPFDERTCFETYRLEIFPDVLFETEAHLSGTEEYLTVFSGSVQLTADGVSCTLLAGDSVRFRGDVPHSYENAGENKAEVFLVIHYAK
ncbi:MAG TPA: XRE family transcriptional regulator [Feifaniaceae bacterium]|nr:XRE family transcriptional regulator [Feifaniaceae bacterium]